jgi:hypothetical protein
MRPYTSVIAQVAANEGSTAHEPELSTPARVSATSAEEEGRLNLAGMGSLSALVPAIAASAFSG